jgi:F-box protein 21
MSVLRLDLLPAELLLRVFKELDLPDILSVGLTCHRLLDVSRDDTICKVLCSRYHFWSFDGPEYNSWFDRLKYRRRLDAAMDSIMDRLVAGNAPLVLDKLLREAGLDFQDDMEAKERLYRHFSVPGDAPDALARRYWASTVMTLLNRRQSLILWQHLSHDHVSLEHAVCSIDMFVRQDGLADYTCIADALDDLADDFFRTYSPKGLSTRDLALLLAHFFVVDKGFCVNPETSVYYKPMCSLVSLSLEHPGSFGMPLTYVCLYCFLAKRIGLFAGNLDAQPLTLPGHAFVMIQSNVDMDLDGNNARDCDPQIMYLDLWRSSDFEVDHDYLRLLLTEARVTLSHHNEYLRTPATPLDVMRRIRRNIAAGYEVLFVHSEPISFNYDGWPLELRYAMTCLTAFIHEPEPEAQPLFTNRVPYLTLSSHANKHPWDLLILQRNLPPDVGQEVLGTLYNRISKDLEGRPRKRRTPYVSERVRHNVGTLFRHRRYGYVGFITGWTVAAPDAEAPQNSFYNIMYVDLISTILSDRDRCWDNHNNEISSRHVSEENVVVLESLRGVPEALKVLAGRYFLRWDTDEKRFINNNIHEYPDD